MTVERKRIVQLKERLFNLGTVLIHVIYSSVNTNMWHAEKLVLMEMRMEVSFDKLYKRIQERAFSLLQNMLLTVATKQPGVEIFISIESDHFSLCTKYLDCDIYLPQGDRPYRSYSKGHRAESVPRLQAW